MDYTCPRDMDSFECGSILYGALTKGMDSLQLLEPYPAAPFSGISFEVLCLKACNIRSPRWSDPRGMYGYGNEHPCYLNRKVADIAAKVMNGIHGLELKDFARA